MKNQKTEPASFQYEGSQITFSLAELQEAVTILRAITHPLRQEIIQLLKTASPKRVTEVFIALRIEQSVASQQLGILRDAGIVTSERVGKFVYYSLNEERLQQILQLVADLATTRKT